MEIWNLKLDSFFWFFASGKAFFAGILLLLAGIFATVYVKKYFILFSMSIAIPGAVLIGLSSTPISSAWWWLWISGFALLYLTESLANTIHDKTLWTVRISLILLCLLPGLLECRYWFAPVISLNDAETIYVIGDSVSSGLGGPNENTWPKILSGKLNLPVVNLAVAGATAESALKKQLPLINKNADIVILEIGGNDILNSTKPDGFEKSMRLIFSKLKVTANNVVWLELPLLPWKIEYGRIQRNLAKEFKITLIPKRILSEVFQTPEATSDSIHLTEKGHQLLGQKISQLFKQMAVSKTPEGS